MRSKDPNKRWGNYKENDTRRITTDMVDRMKLIVSVGDTVKAEIWRPAGNEEITGKAEIKKAKVLKKYPHVVLTDKGCATWNNIAIHNQELMEGKPKWMT